MLMSLQFVRMLLQDRNRYASLFLFTGLTAGIRVDYYRLD